MNHHDVEQDGVVDRYLLGRLPAEEAARFEEHYLGCAECVEQLELGERLHRGLRRAVAQDVVEVAAARQVGWLVRLVRSPALSAVVVIVVIVGLPGLFVYRKHERLGHELEVVRSTVAELRQSDTSSRASVDSLERDLASARAELAAEKLRWEQELASEKSSGRSLSDRLAAALRPQLNVPIFSLQRFRDATLGAPASPQVVRLAAEPERIVLSLELSAPENERYRLTLLQGKREVLRLDGLKPDPLGALVFSLHSSVLETGDYLARVESLPAGGQPVPAGRFSFRVVQDS
jgi:Putative zinc-finger